MAGYLRGGAWCDLKNALTTPEIGYETAQNEFGEHEPDAVFGAGFNIARIRDQCQTAACRADMPSLGIIRVFWLLRHCVRAAWGDRAARAERPEAPLNP
jgi:hypothetical protein